MIFQKISLRLLVLVLSVMLVSVAVVGCGQSQPNPSASEDPGAPQEPQGEHHHEGLVEWSAMYDLEAGTYDLVFQESEGDPSIMVVFLDARDYNAEGDDLVAQHTAEHLMEAVPAMVSPGTEIQVVDGAAYNLALEPAGTTYKLQVPESASFIVMTEHFAWEFDMQIVNEAGTAVESYNAVEYAEPHSH